jgi:large subunit ribosomal protein L7/L12
MNGGAMAETNLTESVQKIVELVEKMSVAELSSLVTALKDKFGVTGAAFMPAAMPAGGAAPAAAKEEEQAEFKLTLVAVGDGKKIPVLKELRALLGLGLTEAKDILDKVPSVIKEGANKEEADKIRTKLEEVGAKVEVK